MNNPIQQIQESSAAVRSQITHHPVFSAIKTIEDLQIFMEYHIYAVWDFMSLLKALQTKLTCTSVPWFPKGEAKTRYLINEIVLGEESDLDMDGNRTSHFELYLEAMSKAGANTAPIHAFLSTLQTTGDLDQAFKSAATPDAARDFVNYTFEAINEGQPHILAAIFTFGREDLIPDMFHAIVSDLHQHAPEKIATFKYYLERHIEVDGDHHSHLALEMTANLCGENAVLWQQARQQTLACLQMRVRIWDGAYQHMMAGK